MLADFKTTTTENILKWNSGPSEQKHLKKTGEWKEIHARISARSKTEGGYANRLYNDKPLRQKREKKIKKENRKDCGET